MQVVPETVQDTVPGQHCVLLVSISGGSEPVEISARAGISQVDVVPQDIAPGQVAEATVIPDESLVGQTLSVDIVGKRHGMTQTAKVTLEVQKGLAGPATSEMAQLAAELRDKFIPWLAANHPELGITQTTQWTSVVVLPHIMVVMYHLFFSDEWEMGIRWHVTIPPHDWVEIYLRHRGDEIQPSHAFKISSREAQAEPQPVEPEESVWR